MSEEKMREEFESYWRNGGTFCDNPFTGKKETSYDAWQSACAHKESEFSKEREQLRALIAMQAEALKRASISLGAFCSDEGWTQNDMDTMDSVDAVLCSTNNSYVVAAWEAEKLEPLRMRIDELEQDLQTTADALGHANNGGDLELLEPLRREVAMLRALLIRCDLVMGGQINERVRLQQTELLPAIEDTQATAFSYERELKAKVLEEAFSKVIKSGSAEREARLVFANMEDRNDFLSMVVAAKIGGLRSQISRANKE